MHDENIVTPTQNDLKLKRGSQKRNDGKDYNSTDCFYLKFHKDYMPSE